MSLVAILDAIRASGEAQVNEIRQEARTQQRAIFAEAQARAAELKAETRAAATQPAFRERARILHSAHLEALRVIAEAREALMEAVLSQARGHLASFRSRREYPQVLQSLVRQALGELQESFGQNVTACVQADPRDKSLLEAIISETGLDIQVAYVLESWGGVIIQSYDQRVVVVNTLEARLERALPYLRRRIPAQLEQGKLQDDFSMEMESAS